MRIKPGQKICLDTNVLLDATDEGRALHGKAQSVFAFLPANGADLFLATQVIREYLVVATRPEMNNGLGLAIREAVDNVREFQKQAAVIPESLSSCRNLLELSVRFQTTGKKLHDLQILATAHEAGVQILITSNASDFPRIPKVAILPLIDVEFD
jgi:predicted nucleic acid-binding protein